MSTTDTLFDDPEEPEDQDPNEDAPERTPRGQERLYRDAESYGYPD